MARNLKTGWVIVATSGSTIDGREIKKEWLNDMAAHYSERVYCARLWPDHKRVFGAQGKVLALKVEPATEPDLKGEVHLMAILAPSDDLVYANRSGRLIYTSIEVLKNFANKGFFYLGGLAVTDEPASLGTGELQFSADGDSDRFYLTGSHVDLSGAEPEKSFFSFFRKPTPDDQEHTMTPEQLAAIQKSQSDAAKTITDAFAAAMGTLTTAIEKFTAKPADKKDLPDNNGKGEGDAEEFVSKKSFDELNTKFTELTQTFEELKKKPAGSTTPAGDDSGTASGEIC